MIDMPLITEDTEGISATYTPNRKYRYQLHSRWSEHGGSICFINIHPTRDHVREVTHYRDIAQSLGYGALSIVSIFALISARPEAITQEWDPVGRDNDTSILQTAQRSDALICNWGSQDHYLHRGEEVKRLLLRMGFELMILNSSSGNPRISPMAS